MFLLGRDASLSINHRSPDYVYLVYILAFSVALASFVHRDHDIWRYLEIEIQFSKEPSVRQNGGMQPIYMYHQMQPFASFVPYEEEAES